MTKGKWTDKVQRDDFNRMVKRALTACGIVLEGTAIALCPVKTGRLKGSITYAVQNKQSHTKSPAVSGDKINRPTDQYTLYVGTNVDYAQHVEYGTRRPTPAQPFMRPALDYGKKDVEKIFQREIKAQFRGK